MALLLVVRSGNDARGPRRCMVDSEYFLVYARDTGDERYERAIACRSDEPPHRLGGTARRFGPPGALRRRRGAARLFRRRLSRRRARPSSGVRLDPRDRRDRWTPDLFFRGVTPTPHAP